ncbi:bifunctional methylenetetrahydrofolate dehydrogenase/methenyltetrahydrofolate cyclohydrolase FolD [Hujiaoplasma nucleasis]|uniref:Bifunctional protein FolD n=1 Tax=Hujiaoplasma nucleasis TaxID=2725268 RepID=A0A7L6N4L8_9MOLU|nr:bifunctional methylenetetrahydrofolate dehydrogenase/methenyltetrahydrofolate cyclohydrolase FolD [Hujiaoplasma nucleasis]QLY40442.1 bifunctional methylenetetrahydrofolate dehydrogenase/methenyltetrahydrofolate cyclohydrolase FolD [Hujiaoplasma nucleasis]
MSQILDGKKLSKQIKEDIKTAVVNLYDKYGKKPHLVVILIGDDPASETYVASKERSSKAVGIKSTIIKKESSIKEDELIDLIQELNSDNSVHGILLQLPIPKHIDEEKVINLIEPKKDVDGFSNHHVARLNKGLEALVPCTPLGIMELLKAYQIDIEGKHAVVMGRSQIVGKPMASLLLKANATVTITHSRTKDMKEITKQADILVVAIGKAKMVDESYVKEGAVLIDVGISRIDGKLYGDIDFDSVKNKASYITPVPGGVGPMTIAMLLKNTVTCFKNIMR